MEWAIQMLNLGPRYISIFFVYIYSTKKTYKTPKSFENITFQKPDRTGHKGGRWKMFNKSGERLGTFDKDLINKIGE